jgi:hypothetical protein
MMWESDQEQLLGHLFQVKDYRNEQNPKLVTDGLQSTNSSQFDRYKKISSVTHVETLWVVDMEEVTIMLKFFSKNKSGIRYS